MPDRYRKAWERLVTAEDDFFDFVDWFGGLVVLAAVSFGLSLVLGLAVWAQAMTGDLGCIGAF